MTVPQDKKQKQAEMRTGWPSDRGVKGVQFARALQRVDRERSRADNRADRFVIFIAQGGLKLMASWSFCQRFARLGERRSMRTQVVEMQTAIRRLVLSAVICGVAGNSPAVRAQDVSLEMRHQRRRIRVPRGRADSSGRVAQRILLASLLMEARGSVSCVRYPQ